MKNIHILPTDKPSRVRIGNNGNFVIGLSQNATVSKNDSYTNQNIYITSDEEIKEGDWFVKTHNIRSGVFDEVFKSLSSSFAGKKIILTTDQDLIKDGVQAIDDEFLEWFVKNPSCEVIEVEREKSIGYAGDRQRTFYGGYKLIIPKEEPKQNCKHDIVTKYGFAECQNCGMEENEIVKEESKQEIFIKTDDVNGEWLSPIPSERQWQEEKLREIFENYPNASPKWQYMNGLIQNSLDAKEMYSEGELRKAMNWMLTQYFEFHEWPAMGRVDHYVQSIKSE